MKVKDRINRYINFWTRPAMDITRKNLKTTKRVLKLKRRLNLYFTFADKSIDKVGFEFVDTMCNMAYLLAYYEEIHGENIHEEYKEALIYIRNYIVYHGNGVLDTLHSAYRGTLEGHILGNYIEEQRCEYARKYFGILCKAVLGYKYMFSKYLTVFDIRYIEELENRFDLQIQVPPPDEFLDRYEGWVLDALSRYKKTVLEKSGMSEEELVEALVLFTAEGMLFENITLTRNEDMLVQSFNKAAMAAVNRITPARLREIQNDYHK